MDADRQVAHGALDEAELAALGLRADQVVDFSSNINPFGPPPSVYAALRLLDPAPYPDRSCLRLRQCLAQLHDCAPAAVLPGNGANELIHLVARAFAAPTATALIVGPTYGEYAHACRLSGMQVVELRSAFHDGFQPDHAALLAAIERLRPRLVWICSPNNPTGVALTPTLLRDLAHVCALHDGFLVVDRAYLSLSRDCAGRDPLDETPPAHLIRIYSLTKSYAVAGLRIGYLVADPVIVSAVARFQPAWSVSSAAQAAALAMLADRDFVPVTLPRLWAASDELVAGLQQLGLTVWRATMPFALARCANATATRQQLLRHGCMVRDCSSFGLPEWVRVAPRASVDNHRLLAAWRAIL